MLTALLVTLLAAPVADEPARPRARFCLSSERMVFQSASAECKPVMGEKVTVSVQEQRLFVWTNPEATKVVLGRVSPGATTAEVKADTKTDVQLRLDSPSREWPADTRLTLRTRTHPHEIWNLDLPADAVRKLTSVAVPLGVYDLTIAAPHHDSFSLEIDARAKRSVGTIRLTPLPMVTGKVIDRLTSQPLAGAVVLLPSEIPLALSDPSGEFRAELPAGEHPVSLKVSYGGYATRTVMLPRTRGDVTLPPILLGPGGELRLTVDRDAEKDPTIRVHLVRTEGRAQIPVRDTSLDGSTNEWLVEDLDPGEYVVTVSGVKPLQRLAQSATVKQAEVTEVAMKIEAIELRGFVVRGEARVPDATIAMKSSPYAWTAALSADDRGEFIDELWQAGRFLVRVTAPDLRSPYSFMEVLEKTDDGVQWRIGIPSGSISGEVIDARSKQPVGLATVTLDSELFKEAVTSSLGTSTAADGRFVFEGVPAGEHTITVEAPDYLPYHADPFAFAADGDSKHLKIPVARAGRRPVVVAGLDGVPIFGAVVLHEALLADAPPTTDINGRAEVEVDPGAESLLIALPKTGSFGLMRLRAARDVPPIPARIVVLPPAARLLIRTVDESTGKPVTNVNVLVRYNGEFLTPRLMMLAMRFGPFGMTTDTVGSLLLPGIPSGSYELWPYGAWAEAVRIMQGGIPAAALVGVAQGEYAVRLELGRP